MKKILYLAIGALALSACTSEEVVDDAVATRNAISFENAANKFSRAEADLTYADLSQFNVFGFYTVPGKPNLTVEVFYDVPVTRKDNATWDYKTGLGDFRYWVKDAEYYFYAYSCGKEAQLNNGEGSFTMDMNDGLGASARALKINNYVCDASHQHDLIYSSATGIKALDKGNKPVAFQFKHILAKVKAQFTNNFPGGYTAEISNVSFENIRNKGDYNPNAEGGWQNQSREGQPMVYLLNTTDPEVMPLVVEKGKGAVETNAAYVIPYAYSGTITETENTWVYLKFTLTLKNDKEVVAVKELTGTFNPSWAAGFSYLYNIELTGTSSNFQAIVFTTTTDEEGNVITNWGDGNGGVDKPIYIDSEGNLEENPEENPSENPEGE